MSSERFCHGYLLNLAWLFEVSDLPSDVNQITGLKASNLSLWWNLTTHNYPVTCTHHTPTWLFGWKKNVVQTYAFVSIFFPYSKLKKNGKRKSLLNTAFKKKSIYQVINLLLPNYTNLTWEPNSVFHASAAYGTWPCYQLCRKCLHPSIICGHPLPIHAHSCILPCHDFALNEWFPALFG